jgi:drug/metabolite transporter (DMT)-like permease
MTSQPARQESHQHVAAHRQGRALSALVLGGICLGCSPILVRVSELGPIATAFWRSALALLPLAASFATGADTATRTMPRRLSEHTTAALPGVALGGDLMTWHISIHLTSVTNSTLLANMAPVVVTLVTWVFLRRPPRRAFLFGLALSIAGVFVLNSGGSRTNSHWHGDVVALVAACFYAGYFMLLARARRLFSTSVVMLWSTTAAAVCILPVALIFEPAFVPTMLAGWAVVLALGWVVHAGGQGLVAFSMAWLPATFSSLTLLIQPVVAAVLAWMFLGEPLTAAQAAGGTIVIVGIVLARRGAT